MYEIVVTVSVTYVYIDFVTVTGWQWVTINSIMPLCACMNYMCLMTYSIMWLVLLDFHTSSFTIFILRTHCCSMLPLPTPTGRGIGRRQTGGAAASPRPFSRRLSVDNEDDFTPPNLFNVWSTELCRLPERNSSPIDYFLLLFTVAMMSVVLRNTQEYAQFLLSAEKNSPKKNCKHIWLILVSFWRVHMWLHWSHWSCKHSTAQSLSASWVKS